MNCPSCKSEMKPLFTGFYCPRDCDRPGSSSPAIPGPDDLEYTHYDGTRWSVRIVQGDTVMLRPGQRGWHYKEMIRERFLGWGNKHPGHDGAPGWPGTSANAIAGVTNGVIFTKIS